MKSIMHLFEELVREKCGPNGVKILNLLEGKENISEFVLSEKLDMNINELRILLYKLTEDNLISSIRKKDKDKGWYVYYWTFNFRHARDLLIKHKENKIQELKNKLANKEVPRYICPNGCISLSLEDAMEVDFRCSECNSLLKLKEVKYNEEVIKKKITEIEEELDKIRKAVIIEVVPEKKVVKRKVKKKVKKKKAKKKKIKKKIKKKKSKKKVKKKIKKKVKKKIKKKPKKKIKKKLVKKNSKPKKKLKPKGKIIKKKLKSKKKPKLKKKPKRKGLLKKIRRKIKF